MVAALVRSANRCSCCSLMRFSMSPRAQHRSSYSARGSQDSGAREVTTKRGLALSGRCSALPTTRRVRLQLLRVVNRTPNFPPFGRLSFPPPRWFWFFHPLVVRGERELVAGPVEPVGGAL